MGLDQGASAEAPGEQGGAGAQPQAEPKGQLKGPWGQIPAFLQLTEAAPDVRAPWGGTGCAMALQSNP